MIRFSKAAREKLALVDPVPAETRLLKPVAQAIVQARTRPFNTEAFYQTRKGLYIDKAFADNLDLRGRSMVYFAPERRYVAWLIKENASAQALKQELPKTIRLSSLEGIAALITAQPFWRLGLLLTNSRATLCYVLGKNRRIYTVVISRDNPDYHGFRKGWCLSSQTLEEAGYYFAGHQVLSPAE